MTELVFDAEDHSYSFDGKPLPSVTQILEAVVPFPKEKAFPYWNWCREQGVHPDDHRAAKANIGTQVHLAFNRLALGEEVDEFDYPEEAAGFIGGCRKWIDKHGPEFLATERQTFSLWYWYAGTLDGHVRFTRGEFKGRTARIDLKTGRLNPDSHFPQLEAYELADVERGFEPSDFRAVLKVTKGGSVGKLIVSTDTKQDWLVLKKHYDSVEARKVRAAK